MTLRWRIPIEKQDDSLVLAAITPEGKQEAESYASGGPKFDVLSTLNEKSPLSAGTICHETGLDISQVKHILNALMKDGYVRKVQSQESTLL